MTILLIIVVAIALAFVVFKAITGMVKFGVLAIVILLALFIAHRVGAF